MKKRLGDFTLDEINAECRKHRECKNCLFQYGEEGCQIKQFLKHVYADFGDDEIELPEPKKCKDCTQYESCDEVEPNEICDEFKQKKHYRPFNDTDELIVEFKRRFNVNCPDYTMPLVWIRAKETGTKVLITGFRDDEIKYYDFIVNLINLFKDYTFLDGSPCGMEVGE